MKEQVRLEFQNGIILTPIDNVRYTVYGKYLKQITIFNVENVVILDKTQTKHKPLSTILSTYLLSIEIGNKKYYPYMLFSKVNDKYVNKLQKINTLRNVLNIKFYNYAYLINPKKSNTIKIVNQSIFDKQKLNIQYTYNK